MKAFFLSIAMGIAGVTAGVAEIGVFVSTPVLLVDGPGMTALSPGGVDDYLVQIIWSSVDPGPGGPGDADSYTAAWWNGPGYLDPATAGNTEFVVASFTKQAQFGSFTSIEFVAFDADVGGNDVTQGYVYARVFQSNIPTAGDRYIQSDAIFPLTDKGGNPLIHPDPILPSAFPVGPSGFAELGGEVRGGIPTPLTARAPLGSLVYDGEVPGQIAPAGDTDTFTIDLDTNQWITVVVDPSLTLQPVVELRNPAATLVASASAAMPGDEAVIQAAPVSVAGTYTITVDGTGGVSTGDYLVEAVLNAVVESEEHSGPANDTPGTAEDLDPAFAALRLGAGHRAAVVGLGAVPVSPPLLPAEIEPNDDGIAGGSLDDLPFANDWSGSFTAAGGNTYTSALTGEIISGSDSDWDFFRVFARPGDTLVVDLKGSDSGVGTLLDPILRLYDSSGTQITFDDDGGSGVESRISYSSFADEDAYYVVADSFGSYTGTYRLAAAHTSSGGIAPFAPGEDWYQVNLAGGEVADLVLARNGGPGGPLSLELYDASLSLLASGWPGSNAEAFIQGVAPAAPGAHFIRVSGASAYNLVVTRDATFEREPNDVPATGTLLPATGAGLGYVAPTGDLDGFEFSVNAGDNLVIETATPAGGPLEFANGLDPILELFDPDNVSVAFDDNSAGDGRNALLLHTASVSGNYRVAVADTGPSGGEYVVHVTGATGSVPPFEVLAATPADSALLNTFPTQVTIDFNRPVLLSSLDASDLVVGGLSALSVTVIDGSTVVFDVDPLANVGDGLYTMSIAGGAVSTLQGQALSPFASSFTLDQTAPRVIGSTVQEGDAVVTAGGLLNIAVVFDEVLQGAPTNPSNVSLAGSLSGPIAADTLTYQPGTSTLTLNYSGIGEDDYTLTLDGSGLRDLAGNFLDGEPLAFPIPPNVSGDGVAGGDFAVNFATDIVTDGIPIPPKPKPPLGSLVYDATVSANIGIPGDQDDYTIALNAGQTLTVVVDPAGGLQPRIQLRNPGGIQVVAPVTSGAGLDAVVQTVFVPAPGIYTISVSGTAGTTGTYDLALLLNAAVETEAHDGAANDTPASAQDINASFITLKRFGPVVNGMGNLVLTEPNDTAGSAMTPGIGPGPALFTDSGEIGDNPDFAGSGKGLDVDLIAISLDAGSTVTIDIDAEEIGLGLDSFLRVFNPSLVQVADSDDNPAPGEPFTVDSYIEFTAAMNGTYLVGVSGFSNSAYDPAVAGSGSPGATGAYEIEITILGGEITRGAVLGEGSAPPGGALRENFESGALDAQWTTSSSDTNGRIRVTGESGTAAGDSALLMDRDPNGSNTLNEAIWTVDLTGFSAPILTFYHAEWSDEELVLPTNFTGSANGDGVAISDDGVNWHTVVNAPHQPHGQWQDYSVDLAAETAAAGMTLGSGFQIKFQQFDDYPLPTDGRGYDEIRILDGLDYYAFRLHSNEVVSVGLSAIGDGGRPTLELLDAAGSTVLGGGVPASDPGEVISDFLPPTNGIYLARVISDAPTYSLVVVRNAGIDTESNNALGTAQAISPSGSVLGSVETTIFAFDLNGTEILTISIDTGAILDRFASPVAPASGPDFGLATTPSTILAGGASTNDIVELDSSDGSVLRTLPNPGVEVSGMAFLDDEIFLLTDAVAGRITVLDYADGAVSRVITASVATVEEALGSDGIRLLGLTLTDELHEIDPVTGSTTSLGTLAHSPDGEGIAVAGGKLLVSDFVTQIDVYDLADLAFVRSLDLPGENLEALGGDGNLAGADFYRVPADPGDALFVSTETPLDGPLAFGNDLDPRLELFGPGGDLVAVDADSATDGKNATLAALINFAGDHVVHVAGEAETDGEYLLHVQTIPAAQDLDMDGLSDAWEIIYGLRTNDNGSVDIDNGPDGDPDMDGANNAAEEAAGTNPRDPDSLFAIIDQLMAPAGGADFTFNTVPGKSYAFDSSDEYRDGSLTWNAFRDGANGVGTWMETNGVESTFTAVDDYSFLTTGEPPAAEIRAYRARRLAYPGADRLDFMDGEGFLWDIVAGGQVFDGGGRDAFDWGLEHVGFPLLAAREDASDRRAVVGVAPMTGVQVLRRIFVSPTGGFARFLDYVHNPNLSNETYTVWISTDLGSDGATAVIDTSSGDILFDAGDDWIVTDDGTNGAGDPVVLHIIAGPGGQRPASVNLGAGGGLDYSYDLLLAPGETRIVMHFAAQNNNGAAAVTKAASLVTLPPEALEELSNADRARVVNFVVPSH